LNNSGRLGDGTTADHATPVQVGSSTSWVEVAAGGAHTCGIQGRSLFCWGANSNGQVGDGTNAAKFSPTAVGVGLQWSHVATGSAFSIGLQIPTQ
jgi:alpha-tubulin suppressor-like RCC1 family protein